MVEASKGILFVNTVGIYIYKQELQSALYAYVCCVAAVVKNGVFFLGVLKYVVCLCRGCDGCCVFVCIVRRITVGARVWEV